MGPIGERNCRTLSSAPTLKVMDDGAMSRGPISARFPGVARFNNDLDVEAYCSLPAVWASAGAARIARMEKTCEASIVVSWKGGEWDNGIVHPVQMSLIYTLLQIQISDKRISGANATKGSSPTDWSEIGSAARCSTPPLTST